jgi:hypothetical protein
LEKRGKRSGDLVVLGVGGESRILVPKKFEESRGLVVEAILLLLLLLLLVWYVSSLPLSLSLWFEAG